MMEQSAKQEVSTKDLIYKVGVKCLWFVMSLALMYIIYGEMTRFFFENLEYTSQFWVYTSGLISLLCGLVFDKLYDTAFD